MIKSSISGLYFDFLDLYILDFDVLNCFKELWVGEVHVVTMSFDCRIRFIRKECFEARPIPSIASHKADEHSVLSVAPLCHRIIINSNAKTQTSLLKLSENTLCEEVKGLRTRWNAQKSSYGNC